jgi:hypothetical protein
MGLHFMCSPNKLIHQANRDKRNLRRSISSFVFRNETPHPAHNTASLEKGATPLL